MSWTAPRYTPTDPFSPEEEKFWLCFFGMHDLELIAGSLRKHVCKHCQKIVSIRLPGDFDDR